MNKKMFNFKILWKINIYPALLLLAFLIWCFAFRRFLSGELWLVSDATAYYEHSKAYLDHLIHGIYPMWDPTMNSGIPLEYFLRRIGSFNPVYSMILLLRLIGMEHGQAYLCFLAVYFFIGMIGYFKLSCLVLHDKRIAFVAYLILMFSSLGTRLFDSFILLTFIPMVWFFYFFMAFALNPKKHLFLGMALTAMILFTTYVPFYFMTILLSFFCFYTIFYFRKLIEIFLAELDFINRNKIFVGICLLAFGVSLIPGVLLFKQAQRGDFVLSLRQPSVTTQAEETEVKNSIEVSPEWNKWALMEDVSYSVYQSSLKKFNFAVLYIPIFAYVIFAFGVIVRINKKLLFLFLWGGFIFLLGSPDVTSVYQFLHDHIFYFKYFRNLHFFLWIVLLPVLVLFLAEQLKCILQLKPRNRFESIMLYGFMTITHFAVLIFFINRGQAILSTYIVLGLSFVFFIYYFTPSWVLRRWTFLLLALIIITSQSVEVFHYLQKNSAKKDAMYRYEANYLKLRIPDYDNRPSPPPEGKLAKSATNFYLSENKKPLANYFDPKWVVYLFRNLNQNILDGYRKYPFYIYDQVEWVGETDFDLEKIGRSLEQYKNMAFISTDQTLENKNNQWQGSFNPRHDIVAQESEDVRVQHLGMNNIILSTNFSHKRFLVYNDSYYDGWQAFINGKKTALYRANVAFKGLWIPEGKNIVEFKFGYWWQYVLNYGLLILFYSMLAFLIYLWMKDIHAIQSVNRIIRKCINIRF